MPVILASNVDLREAADAASPAILELKAGERFEVLELAGANAWGMAPAQGLVGYILASAIDRAAAQ